MKALIYGLIIFELIVAPLGSSRSYAQEATECETGSVYNNQLNRCVLSKDVVEAKSEALNCNGLTGDAYKECFDQNVKDKLDDQEQSGKLKSYTKPKANYLTPALISIAAGVTLYYKKEALNNCPSTSVWLILGGGLSTITGEFLAQRGYKKSVKGMADKYRERMEEAAVDTEAQVEVATTNQTVAFDFQISQEEAREKAHDMRAKTHTLAFALYTASVLAAIYEGTFSATSGGMLAECNVKEDSEEGSEDTEETDSQEADSQENQTQEADSQETQTQEDETPSVDESDPNTGSIYYNIKPQRAPLYAINPELFGEYYFIDDLTEEEITEVVMRKLASIIMPTAHATTDAVVAVAAVVPGADVGGTLLPNCPTCKKAGDFVVKMIRKPLVRAVLGGILALNSKKTADNAKDLAKNSKDRIKFLKSLRADFEGAGGAGFDICKPADRKTIAKPACYCSTEDGGRDPRKENSPTCQQFWASGSPLGAPTLYGADYGENADSLKGCTTKGGSFDPECKCKSKVDSRGNNNCTTLSGQLKLGNLAQINGLTDVMKDASRFTSGSAGTGDLSTSSMDKLVKNVNGNLETLRARPDLAPTLKQIDNAVAKNNKKLNTKFSRIIASRGGLGAGAGGSSLFNGSQSNNKDDMLKDLKKEIQRNDLTDKQQQGKSQRVSSRAKPNFDFNLDTGTAGIQIEDDFAKVMKKDFNYNDISEGKEHNIFKIITNRYHRSGLKRLFNEGDTKPVDAPSKTDINDK